MSDRFDLEQQIMECWRVTDDLKALTEGVLEDNLSHDDITNITIGLEKLYNLRFDRLFRTFESMINAGVIGDNSTHEAYTWGSLDDTDEIPF